jgi:hypothetical protein
MAEEKLDWAKLPPNVRYVAEPAEKYGRYQFELRICDYFDNEMTSDDKAELHRLHERLFADGAEIEAWLDRHKTTEHPEARLVYFTIQLLGLGYDGGWL